MTEAAPQQLARTLDRHGFAVSYPGRDDWRGCRERAASLMRRRELLLPLIFCLAFGAAYGAIAEDLVALVLTGGFVTVLVLIVGGGNIKFWVTLYPLVFLAPKLQLGAFADAGTKGIGLQLYEPWIALLVGLWVLRIFAEKRRALPWSIQGPLLPFVGFGLLAVWTAPDHAEALRAAGRTFFEPLFLFVLIGSLSWTRAELRRVVFVLLAVSTAVAVSSVFTSPTGIAGGSYDVNRLESYWEGTNLLAAFLSAVIVIALGWMLASSSWGNALVGLTALLSTLGALTLTYTRGAWTGLLVAFVLMMSKMRAWLEGALVLVLLLIAVLVRSGAVLERMESIIAYDQEPSAANRLVLWPKVAELIADQPLTGYGFGGFAQLFGNRPDINSYHAHNLFLDFALAMGVPAVGLFLWLAGYVLTRAFVVLSRAHTIKDTLLLLGLVAAIVCLLTAGLTDGSVVIWPILAHTFWFILALTYAFTITTEIELLKSRQHTAIPNG